MRPRVLIACLAVSVCAAAPRPAPAGDAEDPPVLGPGRFRVGIAGGAASADRDWTYAAELSARAGISRRLELAGPLALGIALFDAGDGSGLALGGGIVDAWVAGDGAFLWSPAVALAGRFRTAASASLRAAVDLTGAERDLARGEHPAWIRGAAALLIDMGPYATIAVGASYQRRLAGEEGAERLGEVGWAGDARVSLLAVRTEPFEELPTLAVHVIPALDVVAIVRIDIDLDTRTTGARCLVGVRLDLDARDGS